VISIKISEFSKKYNISKETIRYYTDEKILLPHKVNHYYDYNEQCERDMDTIKNLKEIGFSISDMKELLNYLRLEIEVVPNLNTFMLDFYRNKLKKIDEERKSLDLAEKDLKGKIAMIEENNQSLNFNESSVSGIDLQFLNLLSCNQCSSPLKLKQADIIDGEIINGVLSCGCGMEYIVHDGILLFEGSNTEKTAPVFNTKEDVEKMYPGEYIATKVVIENWLNKKIQNDLKNKDILLDLTVTGGLYFSPLFEEIREREILYIGCERWLNYLKISKKVVDDLPAKPKTMFCCGDIKYAPFKRDVFDKVIDVYGSMADACYTGDLKIQHKISLLKDSGQLYGIYYDISNLPNENAENVRNGLKFSFIENELKTLKKINFTSSPKTTDIGGELDDILKREGQEVLTIYSYIGKKE